jgi:hypothetical protein
MSNEVIRKKYVAKSAKEQKSSNHDNASDNVFCISFMKLNLLIMKNDKSDKSSKLNS